MSEKFFSILSNDTTSILPLIFDKQEGINLQEEYNTNQNKNIYSSPVNEINQIFNNLNILSFLIEKFDELREKEINGNITGFEQIYCMKL